MSRNCKDCAVAMGDHEPRWKVRCLECYKRHVRGQPPVKRRLDGGVAKPQRSNPVRAHQLDDAHLCYCDLPAMVVQGCCGKVWLCQKPSGQECLYEVSEAMDELGERSSAMAQYMRLERRLLNDPSNAERIRKSMLVARHRWTLADSRVPLWPGLYAMDKPLPDESGATRVTLDASWTLFNGEELRAPELDDATPLFAAPPKVEGAASAGGDGGSKMEVVIGRDFFYSVGYMDASDGPITAQSVATFVYEAAKAATDGRPDGKVKLVLMLESEARVFEKERTILFRFGS